MPSQERSAKFSLLNVGVNLKRLTKLYLNQKVIDFIDWIHIIADKVEAGAIFQPLFTALWAA